MAGRTWNSSPGPDPAPPHPSPSPHPHPTSDPNRAADPAPVPDLSDPVESRRRMVREQLDRRGRDISNPEVLRAMASVPRHHFVPPDHRHEAYADHPLPIGHGQTISQPYIVAFMTQALDPQPHDRCLEIGTGSAYQTAVLASLVNWVFSLEIIPELALRAEQTLRQHQIQNVSLKAGDGHSGWPEMAPFDGILVTCATPVIPWPLLDQLADHGRLILPLGDTDRGQDLLLIERRGHQWSRQTLLPVRFVPMTGGPPTAS